MRGIIMNKEKLAKLQANPIMRGRVEDVIGLLNSIPGENVSRPGLKETPWRVAKMYDELFWGYEVDGDTVLGEAVFEDIPTDDIVIVQDINVQSMCEHHMMPFFGKCHIAYIPSKKVVGLSKLARIVDVYARRLQVQERLGRDILDCINRVMEPTACAVIIEAEHTCMTMRGIQKPGTITKTSTLSGAFKNSSEARFELLQLLNKN